jgi:hypothetical protein
MAAGVAALYAASALADAALGGPLDPPGPPGSTMKTLEEIPGTWSRLLGASGADACNTPRFTCVLSSQAVRDNETGLVWQRTPAATSLSWPAALQACGDSLTGGRQGWRLPADSEMRSLLDPAGPGQPILPAGHPFGFTGPFGQVWTVSPAPGETDNAYSVDVDTLDRNATPKTITLRAWCVRGPQADAPEDSDLSEGPPAWYRKLDATGGCYSERFRCVLDNVAVLDRETGLVWQRTPTGQQVWMNAFVICGEAQTGGRGGWRLPTREEIATLYYSSDPWPGLPAGNPFNHGIVGDDRIFWTRTEWETSPGSTGAISFAFGGAGGPSLSNKSLIYRAWCVRGPGASVKDGGN